MTTARSARICSPDVILLDLVMPGMSVRRFISQLKDWAKWARASILLTSAALEEEFPLDLQVDALLPKPFSIERLLELVRGHAHQAVGPATLSSGE